MHSFLGEVRILNRRAWTARWKDRTLSGDTARQVIGRCSSRDDPDAEVEAGLALRTLAWQATWRGDFEEATTHALAAERRLDERRFPVERGDVYSILGIIHCSRCRNDLAESAVERGLEILPRGNDKAIGSYIDLLIAKATIQRHKGQLAKSNVTLGAALQMAERGELARVENNAARCILADNKPAAALEHAVRAADLAEEFENKVVQPYTAEVLADCLWRLGKYEEAESSFATGLKLALRERDRRAQCQLLQRKGLMEMARGNNRQALDLFRQSAILAERMVYGLWYKELALNMATAHEMMGNLASALSAHKLAWRIWQNPNF